MAQALPTDFDELINTHDKPVLVDFWADWCAPCKALAPVLADLAADWKDQATIIKVNTDEKPHIAQRFGITGIPTLILFKNGQEVHRQSGAMPLPALKAAFGSHL